MTASEHHARLTALFGEALELDPEQRDTWLLQLPAELAAELRSLLFHHQRTAPALEQIRAVASERAIEPQPWLGRRLGVWQIDAVLGEGGMGMVFAVHRVEGGFEQQGALKLLRTRFPNGRQIERFRQERDALARLDHPGIARLLDGGESADGELYLVMERISGVSLDRHARQQGLTLGQCIDLIEQACAAVAYAHRHLIVHRDIKPDNLLVSAEGQVKLLDFGIARLLDVQAARKGETTQERAWTPAFAAPEQIAGGVITTATDVYALGAVAWLLLSGAERAPEQGPPSADGDRRWPPPSQAAAMAGRPARARALRGDIDTVVCCALNTASERRYPSTEDFAADLRRALQRQPIRARRDSIRYRLGRFLQRHRGASAAAGLALLALFATTAWSLREAARANREAGRADAALVRSDRINQFLWSVLTAPDPAMQLLGWKAGAKMTVGDLLQGLEGRVDDEFAGDPIAAANIRLALAQGQMAMQQLDTAEAQIKRSLQTLVALGADGEQDAALEAQAAARQMWARIRLVRGEASTAEVLLRQAVSDFSRVQRLTPLRHLSAVAAVHDLGWCLARQGRQDEAERAYREAIERARDELPPNNPVLPISLAVLAELRLARGDAAEALALARESLRLQRTHGVPVAMLLPAWITLAEALDALGDRTALAAEMRALSSALAHLQPPPDPGSALSRRLQSLRQRLGADE